MDKPPSVDSVYINARPAAACGFHFDDNHGIIRRGGSMSIGIPSRAAPAPPPRGRILVTSLGTKFAYIKGRRNPGHPVEVGDFVPGGVLGPATSGSLKSTRLRS